MKPPRLVATDLDGTLLDPEGQVSPFTRSVLERLWAAGIDTLFVTARPPRWLDELADAVGGHGHAICANGALLYDVAAREIVAARLLDLDVVVDLAADLRRRIPGIGFAIEHPGGIHLESEYGVVHPAMLPENPSRGPLARAGVAGVAKLLARVPGSDRVEGVGSLGSLGGTAQESTFVTEVRAVVGERAVVSYSGAAGLAEIGPVGVSKASALAEWCASRGIDAEDVWAFGDMPNDIPMLRWAGRSFAVTGGPAQVREAATDSCGSNAADGVARVLLPLVEDSAGQAAGQAPMRP